MDPKQEFGNESTDMVESDSPKESLPEILTPLPTYSQKEFHTLVECVPSYAIEDGEITGYAKKDLDTVNVWWRKQEEITSDLERFFKAAFTLSKVPKLEAQEAQSRFLSLQPIANGINLDINTLLVPKEDKDNFFKGFLRTVKSESRFEKIQTIREKINTFERENNDSTQIIALCEAINEARKPEHSEKEIRQKIAQSAWEELIALFPYAKIQDDVLTTIDDFENEKDDLKKAIENTLWTPEKQELVKTKYSEYLKQMRSGDYDTDLIDSFKLLYKFTKGIIPKDISAITIILLQEDILKRMYNEDAFILEEDE